MSHCSDTYYDLCCCGCSPCCCEPVKPCTTTTTTTMMPCIGEPCDEFYNCECVIYNGENIECYDLHQGDTLCDILEVIIQNLPECRTTLPPYDCSFTVSVTILN